VNKDDENTRTTYRRSCVVVSSFTRFVISASRANLIFSEALSDSSSSFKRRTVSCNDDTY
jgi:hypothetical protein